VPVEDLVVKGEGALEAADKDHMPTERLDIVIDYLLDTGEAGTLHIAPEDYLDLE
jgi:hypothetical protein